MMTLKKGRMAFLPLVMLLLLSFSSAHKYYVSVTNIAYSKDDSAFQVTSRVFIDDLDKLLKERYDIEAKLATPKESKLADEYIEKYFRTKFAIELDGKPVQYNFLGKRYDNDMVICYLEIPNVKLSETKSMTIQNEVLMDLFDDQQNIVHVKWNGNKKSFMLIRQNNKGMLNL
ncbi:hypothetical protein LDL77_12990 [Flagellimonas marinaquae]|uniref:Peptidase E n=1 Tax=Flagellimonas aurea TaxID=2915619 RepID=A0ABS3G569_9FLAO|nr:DUF6702 family protein [Allomuricauda aurea]MAO16462.1 hypothetical protein [Allomuricauda sp.]MBO0354433.1 hypothetical protein [Allomuricauda aurea]UBZ12805.1 hypothetical protein LDL77_12990 [Allomuricauda aquimarina]|tara:strand:+ start:1528 stop:2046 length:519 start_codon:yes stop_codon:yes gene_type:complete